MRISPLTLILLGCFGEIVSCQKTIDSEYGLKITNGVIAVGDRGIFLIVGENLSTKASFTCSASLIRPDILLTAAHCLKDQRTGEIRSVRVATRKTPTMKAYRIHPQYKSSIRYDVAVIKLDQPIQGAPLVPLADHNPAKGDHGRLVGFGANQYKSHNSFASGSGVKRTGYARITEIDDHFIYSRGIREAMPKGTDRPNGQNSAVAHGDSGGPMLNLDGAIVGIGKAANSSDDAAKDPTKPPVISAHTQLVVVRDFLDHSVTELESL